MSEREMFLAELIASLGAVYCCRADDGKAKIGWAFNVERRVRRLQTGNPQGFSLVAFIPGTRRAEAGLHGVFSDRRLRGEWFDDRDYEVSGCIRELWSRCVAGDLYR